MTVTIGLAFLAGLASFLTPCVFSLMPAYIGYLGSRSTANTATSRSSRHWIIFLHGLFFILGFSLVFIGLGLAASAIGALLFHYREWLARLGGIFIVIFGLQLTGILNIQWLDNDVHPQTQRDESRSLISSLILGICFSAGWSPCVGPILGSILTLAVNDGSIYEGFFLLSAYSVGFAIPFLITALSIEWIATRMKRLSRATRVIEIIMGIILIIAGCLLFFSQYEQIARFGSFILPGLQNVL
ncbi:MAG: cytochrome c biogenesis protein CcdA [Leptolinea sp.]|nr:cytochrome c biogenesis protein CcdA [Leptolinea sp.]